jgi:hypothetical protein
MKKFIFVLMLLFMAASAFADMTYGPLYFRDNFQYQSNTERNPIYLALDEVNDITDGGLFYQFTPTTEPTGSEGMTYYDDVGNAIKLYTGAAWVTLGTTAAGTSLDGSYDLGSGITVDDGAVTLTTSAASDSAAFAIVHGETGNYAGMTLTNASAYPGIQITTSGAGADITGTSATWSISKAGALTCVGITNTGTVNIDSADFHFDATDAGKDIYWDDSEETLGVLDNAVIGFGNTAASPDVEVSWDADSLNLTAAAADTPLEIGGTSAGFDITYAFETAGSLFADYDGDFLTFTDDMDLRFGTGAGTNNGDFQLSSSSANLLTIGQVVAGTGSVAVGVNDAGLDWTFYGDTASAYVKWDTDVDQLVVAGGAEVTLNDDVEILFGTGSSNAGDFKVYGTSAPALVIDVVSAGSGEILIGNDADDVPLKWYAETTSDWVYFNADEVEFEDVVLQLMDGTQIQFGDDDDFYITSGTAKTLDIIPGATADSTAVVNIGADGAGADLVLFGETASHTAWWDASTDQFIFGVDNDGVDVTFFGDTASAKAMWDTSANQILLAGGAQISLNDAVELLVGTGTANAGDFEIFSTNGSTLTIDTVTAETGDVEFGVTDLGIDVKLWAATDAEGVLWDASDEALEFTGANITMDAASVLTATAIVQVDQVVTDAASYSVTAANSGKIHTIANLTQNTTITLPAEADGLNYEFWYIGTAVETHDHIITTEDDGNPFYGGVAFHDTDDGAVASVWSDNNSNSKITINNMNAGTIIKVTCDGTGWYLTGTVISDTTPTIADQ